MSKNRDVSGLKRTMRYFIRQTEIYVALIIAGSFALAFYQKLINGSSMSFQEVLHMIPATLVCMTLVMVFTMGITNGQTWYNMLIAFGCRRRNVFLGSMAMNLLLIAQSIILFGVLSRIILRENLFGMLPLLTAVGLMVTGIAQFLGLAVIKWGKIVYFLMIILVMVCCIIAGVLVIAVLDRADTQIFYFVKRTGGQQWWAVFAGVVIWILSNTAVYRMLINYEVKI